jgi:glutamine amidotransferase
MCLLTYYPGGAMPDPEMLTEGAECNPHGHGFAIVTNRRVITQHGMNADHIVSTFARMRASNPDGPALFHSRFATHGDIGMDNCHPFTVGRDKRTVLAHNGVLPIQARPTGCDTRSDTRILAQDLVPSGRFGSLTNRRGRDRLTTWLGPSNKVVLLTVDPRYGQSAYLFNEERGFWCDGVWYSNLDFHAFGAIATVDVDYFELDCDTCGAFDALDPVTGICVACGCPDCGQPMTHCLCYTPERITV